MEEKYLGGFFSTLQLAFGAFEVGAGIYATTERLLVVGPLSVNRYLRGSLPSLGKIVVGADSNLFAPDVLTQEQNAQLIDEILRHEGVQFAKSNISKLEIKKPPGIFRMGYLSIVDISGRSLKVKVGKHKEYEALVKLLQRFDPDALKII